MPTQEIQDYSGYEVKPKPNDFIIMPLSQGHVLVHTKSCHLKNPQAFNVESMLPVSRSFVEGLFEREKALMPENNLRVSGFCGYCVLRKKKVAA